MSTNNLRPISDVINDLKGQGYTEDFIYRDNKLLIANKDRRFDAGEITIRNEYRFEGDSNPDDMAILYAIEASDGTKGTLVDSYGVNANIELEDFLGKAHQDR